MLSVRRRSRQTESGGGRDDGCGGTKNGRRCTVPPAPGMPDPTPPALAPPTPGSPAPAPPAPVPPAPAPPAPVPPALAPPAPAPPPPVPPAPGSPAPAPPDPGSPAPGEAETWEDQRQGGGSQDLRVSWTEPPDTGEQWRAEESGARPAGQNAGRAALEHIALRYFLARELQQRGQLRLAYVASQANTADVFTKVLGSAARAARFGPTCAPLKPPPCIPCVEGRQHAAPHSSFPPTEAPLQTLHLDVWGPARVRGQGHERYFLLVVDDYTRYTTVFPLQRKGDVPDVLIPWMRATRLQLRERFPSDFPVLRLHSDRGGEFSSDLLAAFCAEHVIRRTFTLPASPQQNGVAERHIGLVMEVARTSMIHAAAPHFLWPFAVRYAAHQLNLWPRVSLPETLPTLLWMGKVGDASRFRVRGARAFVRDTTADKLSPRAIPCSVPFYRLFPYRTAPRPPPPLFLAPGPPQVDPLPVPGPAPSCVSQVDHPAPAPLEVTGDSGPAASGVVPGGAELGGAELGGAESGGAEREEPGGAASRGTTSGGAASGGAEPVCAEPGGAESGGESPEGSETAVTRSPWSSRLCP
ncbi:unnamed protein product [Closterium sp. NIES-54]